jgi:hypothetical protein
MRQFELNIEEVTAQIVIEFSSTFGRWEGGGGVFIFQKKQYRMIDINEAKGWTRIHVWKAIAVF